MLALLRWRQLEYRGIVIGVALLAAIFAIGSALVPGYGAWNNVRSILVLAAFLGIASLGQTLVALVGGLDLSIPFVIGSANILLAFLLAAGLPTALAIILIALGGALVGAINGQLGYRIQGQSLIVTLGVGFALVGASQIVTTWGSQYSGSVFTQAPAWFSALASVNGQTFGLPIPPIALIWAVIALIAVVTLRRARRGREIYAVGDNRTAAARLSISEYRIWMAVHIVSGLAASLTGMLLLGFSGGGFSASAIPIC
jgi:ribose transport system permease protein